MFNFLLVVLVVYLVYRLIKKFEPFKFSILKKVKAAFSDDDDVTNVKITETRKDSCESSNNGPSSAIPVNVRRDILNQQYLFMYQKKVSVNGNTSVQSNEHVVLPTEENASHKVVKLGNENVLVDENGEIHRTDDLSNTDSSKQVDLTSTAHVQRTKSQSSNVIQQMKARLNSAAFGQNK